jgi:hypothetical protein
MAVTLPPFVWIARVSRSPFSSVMATLGECDWRLIVQVRDSPESGRGQPHSKTLARLSARWFFRKVLECGCRLPLSCRLSGQAISWSE